MFKMQKYCVGPLQTIPKCGDYYTPEIAGMCRAVKKDIPP
jgi:hypothetical protein